MTSDQPPGTQPDVALMVTCLVDTMRPSVGFASVKLLEDAGCRVSVPAQTCCGPPKDDMSLLVIKAIEPRTTVPSAKSGARR